MRVRWTRTELNGGGAGLIGRELYTELRTTTDGFGVYVFCSVPRRVDLRVVSSVDGVDRSSAVLTIRSDQQAFMHVIRYAGSGAEQREQVTPGSAGDPDARFTKLGRIRDSRTGQVLDEALVELPEIDLKVATDTEGRVALGGVPPGEYQLIVERRGYASVDATIDFPGSPEFAVLLDPLESADEGEAGAVVGRVLDENDRPVADADVRVVGQANARTMSNAQGRFRIEGLEPGLLEVEFERLGHTSRTARFVIQDGRTAELSVVMPTQAIELAPIEVTVRARVLERSGFYDRRQQGFGHHFDREAIERLHAELVYDVVSRAPGVRVTDPRRSDPTGRGSTVGAPSYAYNPRWLGSLPPGVQPPRVPPSDGNCYLALYIDGVRLNDPDLQQIDALSVEGVEVYLGGSTPIEYRQNQCGAVLVWTRR